MRAQCKAAVTGALSLLLTTQALGSGKDAAPAARSWLSDDPSEALRLLERCPETRDRDLDRAVVLLYTGEKTAAEEILSGLRTREPRWTPALRWLARAQREAGRPEAMSTALALLGAPGADSRDALWAGGLFAERREPLRARDCFRRAVEMEPDLYLGWLGLADAEAALGDEVAAASARARAGNIYQGEEATSAARPLPVLRPGETLRYRGKYLFFRLATVVVENRGRLFHNDRWVHRIHFSVQSNPALFFLSIHSEFESLVDEDGAVVAHRNVADDSTCGRRAAAYDMDPVARLCTVRSVAAGLFAYDRLPLPAQAQDGISLFQLSRALARTRGSLSVLTAVDGTWKGTQFRTLGPERIRWRGKPVDTVRVESLGRYQGPGGLSGAVTTWLSDDERSIPYRARMKIAVGSVVLELLPDSEADSDSP